MYGKHIICNICDLPILKGGVFSKEYGACHKSCLMERLAWEKVCFNLNNAIIDIEGETEQGMSCETDSVGKRVNEVTGLLKHF